MIEAKLSTPELLELPKIHELIEATGPCVTLLVPPYRPGEQSKPLATIIKNTVQVALLQFSERGIPENVVHDLMNPLLDIARSPEGLSGSHWGQIVFRSPNVLRQFTLTDSVKPALFLGSYFEIRPILVELDLPAEFYLLKVTKKNIELLRCSGLELDLVRLPVGTPETLEEAMEFEQPDHDLENRSAAGSSAGAMPGVRFGTGSGKETQHAHLADFFRAVDRGVRRILNSVDVPLILAGVDEDTAIYRMVNSYANLLARSLSGSPMQGEDRELLPRAMDIVRADRTEHAAKALMVSRERLAPARYATGLNAILKAAVEGRIGRLYIDQAARMYGAYEGQRHGERWGDEDLLNIAAAETLLHGGSAYSLPSGRIPDGAPIAAILRY